MRSLLFAFLTIGCSTSSLSPEDLAQSPDLAPALPDGVHALAGIDETLSDDDLQPLDSILGNANNVGLGESVHTTGGYTQAKFRIIKYLVEKRGFRAIGWEWQRVDGQLVEDYIVDGTGTAHRAAQGLSVWASVTTQNLIEWLRSWNVAHPDDLVHFFGFDVQQPAEDKQTLANYLMKQGGASLLDGISECDLAKSTMPMFTQDQFDHCMAGLQAIDDFLKSFSGDELEWARIALVGLRAWQPSIFYEEADLKMAMEARDTGMAYVFQKTRMLKFPSGKIILWAHNEHLEQDHPSIVNGFGQGSRAMGTQLHDALGGDFVSIGLCGYDVNIDWPNVGCGSIGTPSRPDDVEVMLHNLGQNYLLVDLSRSFFDSNTQYGFSIDQKLIPAHQFQGLIYLEHDPKMDPLDWPSCTP